MAAGLHAGAARTSSSTLSQERIATWRLTSPDVPYANSPSIRDYRARTPGPPSDLRIDAQGEADIREVPAIIASKIANTGCRCCPLETTRIDLARSTRGTPRTAWSEAHRSPLTTGPPVGGTSACNPRTNMTPRRRPVQGRWITTGGRCRAATRTETMPLRDGSSAPAPPTGY